jgi:hypothetical protein
MANPAEQQITCFSSAYKTTTTNVHFIPHLFPPLHPLYSTILSIQDQCITQPQPSASTNNNPVNMRKKVRK